MWQHFAKVIAMMMSWQGNVLSVTANLWGKSGTCGLPSQRVRNTGPRLNIKTVLSTYGDFHVKDRPLGRLIFNMGIAIPGKTVFHIETAPRVLKFSVSDWTNCSNKSWTYWWFEPPWCSHDFNVMWLRYAITQCTLYIYCNIFSPKNSEMTPHSLPVRASYREIMHGLNKLLAFSMS